MALKGFSLRTVVVTALVSFAISGLGGSLWQQWLARARPSLIVTSVGFRGSSELLRVPTDLVTASENDNWGTSLKAYASFEVLRRRHNQAAEATQRLERLNIVVQEWLNQHQMSARKTLEYADIQKHPIAVDPVFGSSLHGMVRRGEFATLPVTKLTDYPTIVPLRLIAEGYVLRFKMVNILFPSTRVDNDELEHMKLIAESFSRGIMANILDITRTVSNETANELNALGKVRALLEQVLLPEARLFVDVSFYNSGKTSTAIKPYLGLRLLHDSFANKEPILLRVYSAEQPKSELAALLSENADANDESGTDVHIRQFLPASNGGSHIHVAPGEVKTVSFMSLERLGPELGLAVKQVYDAGVLNCQVVAVQREGSSIWSQPTVFGDKLNDADKQTIGALLGK